jgi:DNA-binding response OmpR family regulator
MGIVTVGPSSSATVLRFHRSQSDNDRARSSERPVRILLADDDHDIRAALAMVLEVDGYEVKEVSNGASLLDCLSSWILEERDQPPVDVIVTDIRMPGINGMTIVEGLRASGWTGPIIVISAFGDDVIRERVSQMDNVIFLEKPFNLVDLEKALADVL